MLQILVLWGSLFGIEAKNYYIYYLITPQKTNIDTQNWPCLKGPVTFSKAHHFGALQPLVLGV